MKLSISNIAWNTECDKDIYAEMKRNGFLGLEIAPTRIFSEAPYGRILEACAWAEELKSHYGFVIPSMQSIWFGRQEKIFGTEEECWRLVDYTKKAIDFAAAIGCKNLVFGCPRNRNLPEGVDPSVAVLFFKELGTYAAEHGTTIGMEANPPIYNTNYINDTASALRLIEDVNCTGFKLNLDVGTMIYNDESIDVLKGNVHLVNHVHISEPYLKPITKRKIHNVLKDVLMSEGYEGFISIEVGKPESLDDLRDAMKYVKEIFL